MVKDKQFYKTIIRLSLPAAFQSFVSLLVLMADNIMVSRYHGSALAAVSQANSIGTFISAALTGLGSGGVVLIAQYWGKRDMESVKRVFAVVSSVCVAVGLGSLIILQCFPRAVLSLVLDKNEAELTGIALEYVRIVSLSYLPYALTCAVVATLRGVEIVRVTLYATMLSLLTNVTLNYLLIFGHLGLPEMGVRGAALATVIARLIELSVVLFYCFRVQKAVEFKPRDLMRHERWAFRDYLRFGAPVGLTDAQWALVGVLKMSIIGHLGEEMMSAVSISDTMMNLGTMFTFALAGGACVVVGKAVGEGDMKKVREYSKTIQIMFALCGLVMAGIVVLLRRPFISLYGAAETVSSLAVKTILIGGITLLGTTYHASCFVGINRGAGDNKFVMAVDMICGWLVVLPLTYLAAFVFGAPLPIVYLCTRIDQCYKWIIAFIRLRGTKWIKKVTREEGESAA